MSRSGRAVNLNIGRETGAAREFEVQLQGQYVVDSTASGVVGWIETATLPSGEPMKVASYNANSVRARLPLVLRWLREHSPEVLCLQETKVQDKDFPHDAFASAGYHVVYRGEKSYNGVAIASSHPFENVQYGFDGEGRDRGPGSSPQRCGESRWSTPMYLRALIPPRSGSSTSSAGSNACSVFSVSAFTATGPSCGRGFQRGPRTRGRL